MTACFVVPTNHRVAARLLSLFLFPALTAVFAQQTPPAQPPLSSQPPAVATQPAAGQPAAEPAPPPFPPAGQKLTSNQLDGLVAPIALYPDPLISQILVAATYPREITQAAQWMNQHPDLKGKELADAAQQQTWDPSIRSLVMFPNVLRRLNQDRVWTTNLGDAFLAQQADVMQAVQRMRRAAKDAGKLSTNRQMKVVETTDSGETVIEIEPASPNVIFVPSYNPAWIWGPPLWYPYPRWFWGPPPIAPGVWFGFGPALAVGAYYGAGWGGWGYWGWHPGWFNRTVVVNNTFINNSSVSNVSSVSNTSNVTNTAGAANPATTNPGTTSPAAASSSPTNSSNAAPSSALASKSSAGNTTPASTPAASTNAGTAGSTNANSAGAANANANAASASAGKASPVTPNAGASNAGKSNASAPSAAARPTPQTSTWAHDPSHRQGVPYANAEVAQRFHAPPPGGQRGGERSPNASARPAGAGNGLRGNGQRGNGPGARPRGGGGAPRGGQGKGGGGKR